MKFPIHHAFVLAMFAAGAGIAAGGGDEPNARQGVPTDPVIDAARAANAQNDWLRSQALLRDALAKDPRNADYHNLYAYAIRKGPEPRLDLVFQQYNEALRIDPKHRGAHEYIGEAYLMIGNVAKAKEHLAALDQICFLPCDEFSDLKKAIAEFEARTAKK